ncbi:permease for cytosine/purines, uracil, thiamine, allantoin-domain-containing protein [Dipodascopsis tothii]|uniref:permease for cytosine/purines, uracil, thiamine, allantoin-domain-containing protein n=1 Tax=Dipodascopsis tothii TaxID=44089 RepID=UPI0034CE2081
MSEPKYDTIDDVEAKQVFDSSDSLERYPNTLIGRVQRLAAKYSMEVRGIERVPEDERTDTSLIQTASFWFSTNMLVSSVSVGTIGPLCNLGFWDSMACILVFNALGILFAAWCTTFGPLLGMRQMVMSRYWFGFHGAKVYAFLNCVSCVGWSTINTIVAAQMLHSIGAHGVPPWAGILIITGATLVICMFGHRVVHFYEAYCWVPSLAVLLVLIARLRMSHAFEVVPMGAGAREAGNVLTFGCALFGGSGGWGAFACDYVAYKPRNTSRLSLGVVSFVSIYVPMTFCCVIGLCCMMVAHDGNVYQQYYDSAGIGGIIYALLAVDALGGFGKFCVVVLALSVIGGTCPDIYSFVLCLQTVWERLSRIPRVLWTVLAGALFIGISIPAYYSFEEYMEDFAGVCGYWIAAFAALSLTEHYVFKRSYAVYDPEIYDDPAKLPPGIAATAAFLAGVAGIVIGMDQSYYAGPLAKYAQGDIGMELGAAFSIVTYLVLRTIEYKRFRR